MRVKYIIIDVIARLFGVKMLQKAIMFGSCIISEWTDIETK